MRTWALLGPTDGGKWREPMHDERGWDAALEIGMDEIALKGEFVCHVRQRRPTMQSDL
jgi:hypothetical protein